MKVTGITTHNRKSDNKESWSVNLEGSEISLLMFTKPDFAEGTEVNEASLQIAKNGKYYTLVSGKPTEAKAPYRKNDDDILLSVAFKGAIELERHHYVPEGTINTARVIQTTSEIFAGLVLMRPKRQE